MTLSDLENEVLGITQGQALNAGGVPNWTQYPSSQVTQAFTDFCLNRGYARLLDDLGDLGLTEFSATFTTTAKTYSYPLPPAGSFPAVRMLRRVYYLPLGQGYTVEFEPGVRLVAWDIFNRYTASGYLAPFSYATLPEYCAVRPSRQFIDFFPGPGTTGDTVTLSYAAQLTSGIPASSFGFLVNGTDVPLLPEDAHEAIVYWALTIVWAKLREFGAAQMYRDLYTSEVARLRETYLRASAGDRLAFSDRGDRLAGSSWVS